MTFDFYLGDIGKTLNIDTESTMTSLTTGRLYMTRADGSEVTWTVSTHATEVTYLTLTFGTSTATNYLASTDAAGDWEGNAFVVLGAASSIQMYGSTFILKIG
jgi:hypothetical protein